MPNCLGHQVQSTVTTFDEDPLAIQLFENARTHRREIAGDVSDRSIRLPVLDIVEMGNNVAVAETQGRIADLVVHLGGGTEAGRGRSFQPERSPGIITRQLRWHSGAFRAGRIAA